MTNDCETLADIEAKDEMHRDYWRYLNRKSEPFSSLSLPYVGECSYLVFYRDGHRNVARMMCGQLVVSDMDCHIDRFEECSLADFAQRLEREGVHYYRSFIASNRFLYIDESEKDNWHETRRIRNG